ncbi:MAG TPA: hypothetical protein VE344_08245 [Methylomirabilota bacterium]|nr:hypothetical protein [Methylomirabilota bacterium]
MFYPALKGWAIFSHANARWTEIRRSAFISLMKAEIAKINHARGRAWTVAEYNIRRQMKPSILIVALMLLCGCTSEKERFDRDMREHYEAQCDKYFAIYASDKHKAKKALEDTITLSLAERNKAKYYWRFNLNIAFSEARLAVMAEDEGRKQDAQRLFSSASDYMALQKTMLREHLQEMPNVKFGESATNSAETPTPDQWREAIAKLDAANNVRWKSPKM